jgi:Flp pilus assembly protein TadD
MNRPQEAVSTFRAILERNEQLPEVHAELAWVLADREIDAVRAESHARRALALAPSDPRAFASLAWAELRLGRAPAALESINEAKRAAPRDPRVLYVRGAVLQTLGRTLDARAELRRAIEIDPGFERAADARLRLAELH